MREESADGHMEDFARFGRITASVAPAILRLNKQSRKWAWRVITGQEPDREPGPDAERGIEHEKDAIAAFEWETGFLVASGRFVAHPAIEWLGASPDGFLIDCRLLIPVEVKCPRVVHTELPPMYRCQIQIQLECCNAPYGYFVSWVEDQEPFILKVERDAAWWESVKPELYEFYMQYVKPRVEPPRSPRRTKEE